MKFTQKLFLVFCILVFAKFVLSLFVPSPTIFSDEYLYFKLARSFYYSLDFSVHHIPIHSYPPLYPIVLAFSYAFGNAPAAYMMVKFINAILSSLIIFPAFFLARNFFDDKKSLLVSTIVAFYPAHFAFSPYIMSENLFYTLFLAAFYFFFKLIRENSIRNNLYFGLFAALAVLTKITGVILIANFIVLSLYRLLRRGYRTSLWNFLAILLFGVLLLPWAWNTIMTPSDATTVEKISGGYSNILTNYSPEIGVARSVAMFALWVMNYCFYVIVSLFVVLAIMPFIALRKIWAEESEKTFLILSLVFLVELVAVLAFKNVRPESYIKEATFIPWLAGRIIGRYIDTMASALIILGFVGLRHFDQKMNIKRWFIILAIFTFLGSQTLFYPLVPFNNASLAWLGAISYVAQSVLPEILVFFAGLLVVAMLIFLIYLILKKSRNRNFFKLAMVLFLLVSLISISITFYSSRMQSQHPHLIFSKEIGNILKSDDILVIDEDYCTGSSVDDVHSLCTASRHTSLIGFWVDGDIIVGDATHEADYVLTYKKLPLDVVRDFDGLYLYKGSPLVRQPYLQNVTDTSVTVAFKTRKPIRAFVSYATDLQGFKTAYSEGETEQHFITLKNLRPHTKYFYRLHVDNATLGDERYFFTTEDPSADEVRFAVFGDIGSDDGKQKYMAQRIAQRIPRPDLILIAGDIIYPDGSSRYYDSNLFSYFRGVFPSVPVFPALGNHDWESDPASNFEKEWFLPNNEHYYSFDFGPVHFIVLDSMDGTLFDEEHQREWLVQDLVANKNKSWKIVVVHHNGLTCTYKEPTVAVVDLYPVFEHYDVDLVFTGHAHTYERLYPLKNKTPINQEMEPNYGNPESFITVTTGAGGRLREGWTPKQPCTIAAKLHNALHFVEVSIQENKLTVQAIDSKSGEIFDRFTIEKS